MKFAFSQLPYRAWIVMATFMLAVLLYVDRVCISVAKDRVAADLALTDQQMGWVFAAFSLGYALFQSPAGWMSDRFGPRIVLSAIVSLWSLFTGLSAFAWSLTSMLVVRFLFGAGEAGAFPGMTRALVAWMPIGERGLTQGINFSGSRIGAAFAYPLLALMIAQFGWRPSFLILMAAGFVWVVLWFLLFRDEPTQATWLPQSEREFILAARNSGAERSASVGALPLASLTMGRMLRSSSLWALSGQYFASNFTFFFCLTWLFPQLKERFDLTGFQAGLYASVPLLFGALGNWVSGIWIDRIYREGAWVRSRRLPAIIGFACSAIGLVGSVWAETPLPTCLWFSLSIFGADMTLAPSWAACMDIGQKHSGVLSGTMNMAGNIGAFITALAFPSLLAWTGSAVPFFYLAASLNLLAIFAWLAVNPTRALEVAS